jgi:hypothetical protein
LREYLRSSQDWLQMEYFANAYEQHYPLAAQALRARAAELRAAGYGPPPLYPEQAPNYPGQQPHPGQPYPGPAQGNGSASDDNSSSLLPVIALGALVFS